MLATGTQMFDTLDYVIWFLLFFISTMIGIFYGCFKKQNTTKEFFLGNQKMGAFSTSASLVASFMSAITLLGLPTEVFFDGINYIVIFLAYFGVVLTSAHVYIPVFYENNLVSAYQYLQLRFNKVVRISGSFTYTFQMIFYMSVVLYAPALALETVTGLSLKVCIVVIGSIGTFYTTLGGMKAVIWTDVFQIFVIFTGLIIVIIQGIIYSGGLSEFWERNYQADKFNIFNFDIDPFQRHTFWTLTIGGYFTWASIYNINQAQVQRALWLNLFGLFFLVTLCLLVGMVLVSAYFNCDIHFHKHINKGDQLLPFFVMNTIKTRGLGGVLIASLFSAALSTLSSGLNSLSTIFYTDIFPLFAKGKSLSDREGAYLSKFASAVFGLIVIAVAFLCQYLGGLLQIGLSIFGIFGGPLLGLFTLGMFFPWANSIGAFVGWICAIFISLTLGIGSIYVNKSTSKRQRSKVLMKLFNLSYLYLSLVSFLIALLLGILISLLTKPNDPRNVSKYLLAPCIRKLYEKILKDESTDHKDTQIKEKKSEDMNSKVKKPFKLHLLRKLSPKNLAASFFGKTGEYTFDNNCIEISQ